MSPRVDRPSRGAEDHNEAKPVRKRSTVLKMARLWVIAVTLLGLSVSGAHAQTKAEAARKKAVDRAIARAQKFLLRSFTTPSQGVFQNNYPLGYRSLAAYALLDSGIPVNDRRMQALLDDLDQRPFVKVYSVSLYVLALDAALRNETQRDPKARSGRTRVHSKSKRELRQRRLKEAIDWLVRARSPGEGTWGYGSFESGIERGWQDFSNTQFAVLALQVGINRGVDIPVEVFDEVAQTLVQQSWPAAPERALTLTGRGWWEQPISAVGGRAPVRETSAGLVIQGRPLGWGYRPGRRRTGGYGQYSMVAAASSSLMVARTGLERARALTPELTHAIDRSIAGGLLALEGDWSTLVPTAADTIHRNYFYTLYSFEKAMDLGGVQQLGAIDWYREHAVYLVKKQSASGSWGASRVGREFVEVSTCFAVLFLRRATRFLRVERLDRLVTGTDMTSSGEVGVTHGRVFVPSLEGVVELASFFRSLSDLRTPEYLELAREIVTVVGPHEEQALVPWLVRARSGQRDPVDRFVRGEIKRLTGLPDRSSQESIEKWVAEWRQVVAWGTTGGPEAAEGLDLRLRNNQLSEPLQLAVISSSVQRGELRFVEGLIDRVRQGSRKVSERAHLGLVGMTGRPYEEVRFKRSEDRAAVAQGWAGYWSVEGPKIERKNRWRRLRKALEDADGPRERRRARARIVAMGEEILPWVERVLESDRFAFDWVLIRRELTGGRPKGLRPRD